MNCLVARISIVILLGLVACELAATAHAGGKPKACQKCGCEKQVKQVYRLVKICEQVALPSYVYAKEEVFYPDKGAVCYTGYRSDTFYEFWREEACSKADDPSQHTATCGLTQLHCSASTVCGCRTLYGAKSTGCHAGCSVRVPSKTRHITTPVLKWESVPLCKDCCGKNSPKTRSPD